MPTCLGGVQLHRTSCHFVVLLVVPQLGLLTPLLVFTKLASFYETLNLLFLLRQIETLVDFLMAYGLVINWLKCSLKLFLIFLPES